MVFRHMHDEQSSVRKPSIGSVLMALVPFCAMCFSVSLWDRVEPLAVGIPFNFLWLICWIIATPLCMWVAYRIETTRGTLED
jgi:hypothetical protein